MKKTNEQLVRKKEAVCQAVTFCFARLGVSAVDLFLPCCSCSQQFAPFKRISYHLVPHDTKEILPRALGVLAGGKIHRYWLVQDGTQRISDYSHPHSPIE